MQYKINNQIKAPELRVVGENGENLGVMKLEDALQLAWKKNLDLIEIASAVRPPVAKIISFDKFRYQKEKELKKAKASQKISGLKQVQITLKAAKNDLEVRVRKIEEFLNEGDKVNIVLFLKGREKYNQPWAREKFQEFLKMIPVEYKIIADQRLMGNRLTMQIIKK